MKVSIIADSIGYHGYRLTTFVLHDFSKTLLAELNTHRMFSRNAASSRAIPVQKVIEQVQDDPFIPTFTANQKGMQGGELSPNKQAIARTLWLKARDKAVESALEMLDLGIHKQNANRILEPFMKVPVLVTATEWDNFWKLRCHPDAQPEFRAFAEEMRKQYLEHEPKQLQFGEWHIPFGNSDVDHALSLQTRLKVATARCARVSYQTHDGEFSVPSDCSLHDRLLESGHLSPFEHSARCYYSLEDGTTKNFRGWQQYRTEAEYKAHAMVVFGGKS